MRHWREGDKCEKFRAIVRRAQRLQTLDVVQFLPAPRRLPSPTRDREYHRSQLRRYHKPGQSVPAPSFFFLLRHLVLIEGISAQVLADAHLTYDPVILFEVTSPEPARTAPIQVTAVSPPTAHSFPKTVPKYSIHSPLTPPYLSTSHITYINSLGVSKRW